MPVAYLVLIIIVVNPVVTPWRSWLLQFLFQQPPTACVFVALP